MESDLKGLFNRIYDILERNPEKGRKLISDNLNDFTDIILWMILNNFEKRFNTEDSTIEQDIKYKKIIKMLKKLIMEKKVLDGI